MSLKRSVTLVFAVLLLIPAVFAQDRQEDGVKTFTVKPSHRPVAILAPNALTPVAPEPISPSERGDILKSIGGSGNAPSTDGMDAAPKPGLQHIVLTSRQPFVSEKGYLRLTLPQTVHPESPIVFNKEFPSTMSVNLKVEEGGLYLVDFAVRGVGSGTYKVNTGAGGQEFDDTEGNLKHVLIALNAEASGWTGVSMTHTGTYNLFSVEVTRATRAE
jgi:hypothetical protein